MRLLASVALGGALGSTARWLLGGWAQRRADASAGGRALVPADVWLGVALARLL